MCQKLAEKIRLDVTHIFAHKEVQIKVAPVIETIMAFI